jgi:hypothetical protein
LKPLAKPIGRHNWNFDVTVPLAVLGFSTSIGGITVTKQRRNPIGKQLRNIKRALLDIRRSVSRVAVLARRAEKRSARPVPRQRRLTLTPKRRATLKLQGAYMGYMRQLKPVQKAKVRAVKAKSGFLAAIKLGRRLAGK